MNWPVADRAIINASPLIFLSRSGYLGLLQAFTKEVRVPEPVASEILRRGRHDISARAIEQTEWLIITPVAHIPPAITEWGLGAGESSVLALALAHPGAEAIIKEALNESILDSSRPLVPDAALPPASMQARARKAKM